MSPKNAGTSASSAGRGSAWTPSRILTVALAALALVFIFTNLGRVKVRLIFVDVSTPLFLALAAVFAIGVLVGGYWMRTRK
ncbi:LapA family protein [Actinomycetota bacterium Odt1-20B]